MKRPMLYWVILFILGEVIYKIFSIYMVLFFAIVLFVCLKRRKETTILHYMGIVCFFLGVFCVQTYKYSMHLCEINNGNTIQFTAVVKAKEVKERNIIYVVGLKTWNNKKVSMDMRMSLSTDFLYPVGTIIRGEGKVERFEQATNPGSYDELSYQLGNGCFANLQQVSIHHVQMHAFSWKAQLDDFQSRLEEVYRTIFNEKDASLAIAMTLGEKSQLNSEIKTLYQRNGIAHLIAISGLHIAMIGGTLYQLLRKYTGSFSFAALLGVGFILSYGIMTGLSGATYRAMIMLFVSMGADVFGRKYDGITAMSFALFMMLIRNPYQLYQAGFLLSFGAVLGIVWIHPMWKQLWSQMPDSFNGILLSVSVQMVLLPVTLYFFYEVPVYGVVLNIIVVPLMSVLLFILIVSGIAGLFFPAGADILATFGEGIFSFYEMLCKMAEKLPFHTLCTGKPSVWWIILYYILLCCTVYWVYRQKRKMACITIFAMFMSVGLLFLPSRPLVCMFDVGQGDGVYIRTAKKKHVLIDGGSSTKTNVGEYILKNGLKYYGVSSLDYVFISHSDIDHYSGVKQLLQEELIPIRNIVFPDILYPDQEYLELVKLAKEKGCRIYYMKAGDYINIDKMYFRCLHPRQQVYQDKNAGSLVLHMIYDKYDMLFTGDLDEMGEKLIQDGIAKKIEVLKVSHHGSSTSSSATFLKAIEPVVALISAGKNNQYGHPHPVVLKRLSDIDCTTYITSQCGAITLCLGEDILISTYCADAK